MCQALEDASQCDSGWVPALAPVTLPWLPSMPLQYDDEDDDVMEGVGVGVCCVLSVLLVS